jgi:hypothetical protein
MFSIKENIFLTKPLIVFLRLKYIFMKTKQFLELLTQNEGSELIFEFQEGQFIPKAYHITEIKNIHIESVDCGGRPDEYFQTVVQLWHDGKETAESFMTAKIANKIFEKVNSIKPLREDTPIFFEWGDAEMRTSVYEVNSVNLIGNKMVVKTFVPPTVCKPKYELELAGDCSGTGSC